MINTTLAVAVMSVSAAVSPLSNLLHLHPHMPLPDTRVAVQLDNASPNFFDVKIEGQVYTIMSHHNLVVKAPAGTAIYAGSVSFAHRPGELIATLGPELDHTRIALH